MLMKHIIKYQETEGVVEGSMMTPIYLGLTLKKNIKEH